MTAHAIQVRGASVQIGPATLLDRVDLELRAGEVVAIVGPNGAGKSTLLGAMAGDRRLSCGSIQLAGHDVARQSIPALARLRGVLPQRSELALGFTAREVVQLAGHGVTAARATACLAEVGLAAHVERSYPTLSGGERQRVQLARVLAQLAGAPGAALLLDEPTSALDPRHQQIVLAVARKAAAEARAVVVVLHDLTLAARWADRVVLLARGRVVADAEPSAALDPVLLAVAYDTPFEVLRGAGGLVIAQARTTATRTARCAAPSTRSS